MGLLNGYLRTNLQACVGWRNAEGGKQREAGAHNDAHDAERNVKLVAGKVRSQGLRREAVGGVDVNPLCVHGFTLRVHGAVTFVRVTKFQTKLTQGTQKG